MIEQKELWKGMTVESFLVNHVHNKVYRQYINKQKQDVIQAQKLQNFLRQLKNAVIKEEGTVKTGKSTFDSVVSEEMLSQILNQLDRNLKSNGLKEGTKLLFQRLAGKQYWKRGTYFERELAALWQTIIDTCIKKDFDLGTYQLNTGKVTGTTTIAKNMREKLAEKIAQGVATDEAIKELEITQHDHYQQRVQIKTDINSLPEVNIQAFENPEFQELYSLLQGATVTAKSYTLHSRDPQEKIYKLREVFPQLKLGNAEDPHRAIVGTLQDIGYALSTAEKVFYAGSTEAEKNHNQTVLNHMYHLKYVYELTGAGIWNSLNVGRARFLVFNDPSSDLIYVQSTAELIENILDPKIDWRVSLYSAIKEDTSKFYNS